METQITNIEKINKNYNFAYKIGNECAIQCVQRPCQTFLSEKHVDYE